MDGDDVVDLVPVEEARIDSCNLADATDLDTVTIETGDSISMEDIPVVNQFMDISLTLNSLRKLLENKLNLSLCHHEFMLQNSQILMCNKSLLEQGVAAEGMVQFSVQILTTDDGNDVINIVDIIKPLSEIEISADGDQVVCTTDDLLSSCPDTNPLVLEEISSIPSTSYPYAGYMVDSVQNKRQEVYRLPQDPMLWSVSDVRKWLAWAIREFKLDRVTSHILHLSGAELCKLSHSDFSRLVPNNKGDILWTHLELVRKSLASSQVDGAILELRTGPVAHRNPNKAPSTKRLRIGVGMDPHTPGNRSGNNGQIQLWQFLLEMLTDRDAREIICWVGEHGEFKLIKPESVAQRWGMRKNKTNMNYEKLSRALRYYYDGDMISKVHGKRFVYKFVCDLKQLLGYNASELSRLVLEAERAKFDRHRYPFTQ